MEWFLDCLTRAIEGAQTAFSGVLKVGHVLEHQLTRSSGLLRPQRLNHVHARRARGGQQRRQNRGAD
jgi:hypothetical protein